MDVYDTMQAVMVRAPTLISKHALGHIREAGSGAIGNTASVHGHYVTSDKVAYNVANIFVLGFSELGSHLNGGDLRFDDGVTLTYD